MERISFKTLTGLLNFLLVLSLGFLPDLTRAESIVAQGQAASHVPPPDNDIPKDKYGDLVSLGRMLFTETPRYARRYTGNGLTCANCHLQAGRKPNAAPLWAAYGMYPAYKAKNDRVNTLEERIQQCFRFSMNGIAPAVDAPEVKALVAYSHFLARGAPVGMEMPGRGFPQVPKTGDDPSHTRGAAIYKNKCAACHSEGGGGRKKEDGSYLFPPLWGMDTYNKAAGMANDDTLAGFVKANMPLGSEGTLSDQDAKDLAAYINMQIRPADPRKGLFKGLFK